MTVAFLAVAAEWERGKTGWVLPVSLPFCRQVERATQHRRKRNLLQNYSSDGPHRLGEEEGDKAPV